MYEQAMLEQYPYFRGLMQRMSLSSFHDSLTGLVARPFLLEFVRSLILEQRPFTLAIIDLDNFKSVNDHYGHQIGDEVLSKTAEAIRQYVGGDGVVGRFGGDEFLLVYLKSNDYARLHPFFDGMFVPAAPNQETVFRRHLILSDATPYVTATLGSASFPENAQSFDALFALMDKALYRGKVKGRNCFIIYVPAKHDHLDIRALTSHSLYEVCRRMEEGMACHETPEEKLRRAFEALRCCFGLSLLLWQRPEGTLCRLDTGEVLGAFPELPGLIQDGLFAATDLQEIQDAAPRFCQCLRGLGMESALAMEVGRGGVHGHLVFCPERHALHIWQDAERAAAFVLCMMLAHALETQT